MPTAAIAIGSNLGPREGHIAHAFEALASLPGTSVLARSEVIETAPVGPVAQGSYLNAVAKVQTDLAPEALLTHLLRIEHEQGRDRTKEQRWGPRTLDLDLLLYDQVALQTQGLTLPHPRLHERLFVLVPLNQVWPDALVPSLNRSVHELLSDLQRGLPSGQ